LFFWKRGAQQTGKHALSERHSCSKWACSVLTVVGIYNPEAINKIVQGLIKLDDDSLDYILGIARKINNKKY